MKNYQDIEKAAEEALKSLDNLQQLEANDYLHAKIMQRMQDNRKAVIPMNYNRIMLRLAAVLILLIGINCISFYALKKHSSSDATVVTKKSTGADAFADAYNLNSNSDSY